MSVPADVAGHELLAAARHLHAGGTPLSRDIAVRVIGRIRKRQERTPDCPRLSARQARILRLMAGGLGAGAVAKEMGLKPETVYSYLKLIYRKLGVHNRTEAVIRYFGQSTD